MKDKSLNSLHSRLRSSYITTTVSISLVLFLLGVIGLLILNTKKISDYVKENIGFSVILKNNVKESDIRLLQKNLDATVYVKSTEFITKEQAASELQDDLGEDFVSFLGYNPLLSSINVRLKADYANPDSISSIEKNFLHYHQVKEVFYQKSLVTLINQNVRKISFGILIFCGLLFLISVALINNTIQLSVYAKRFIINTQQLVGASRSFIRAPFLYSAAIQGVVSAMISLLLLSTLIYLTQKEMTEIITFHDYDIIVILYSLVIILGVIICTLSTYLSVNKYLNIKIDKLYE